MAGETTVNEDADDAKAASSPSRPAAAPPPPVAAPPPSVWSTTNETAAALRDSATRNGPHLAVKSAWLGLIISANNQSERYRTIAKHVAASGFWPMLVPAVTPAQYANLAGMLADAFGGNSTHHHAAIGMTPFEIALLMSHKKAWSILATSSYSYGAVFEDDATLVDDVMPDHAAWLIQQTFRAAGARALVYLGACAPHCSDNSTSGGLSSFGLLKGPRCTAYCTHAYALSAEMAATFFKRLLCHGSGGQCGHDCARKMCYSDWVFKRYLLRGYDAWVVGAGFRSRWKSDHRGLFAQNRTTMSSKSATNLRRAYRGWNATRGTQN